MKKSVDIFKFFSFFLLMVAVISCKQINKSIDDTLHGQPRVSQEDAFFNSVSGDKNAPNFLTDASALTKAEQKLKNIPELKGKVIRVYDGLNVYDDERIMLKIQDPDTLENINEYDYSSDKEWGPKIPVKVGNMEKQALLDATIPLDSIHFATIAKISSIYADSVKSKNSTTRLSHIYYVQQAHRWYCNDIEGTRSNYQIYFNANGTVKEFDKQ